MRLGISSPLAHTSAKEWAEQQRELGCSAVVFPVQSGELIGRIDGYKNAAKEYGLQIAEVGIWRNALSLDSDERAANMDYCVEQLRLADYLGARCAVIVDCGIASGADVYKAIALGADAAAVGRSMLPSLEKEGTEGVINFIRGVQKELRFIMSCTGYKTVSEIDDKCIKINFYESM